VGRAILLLAAIALVVGTGLLTFSEWHSSGRTPRLLGNRIAVADAQVVGPEPTCPTELSDKTSHPDAELSLFIRSVDLHALTANVEAAICFPEILLLNLYTKKYGPTLRRQKDAYLTFDPHREFAEASVSVSYTREVPYAGAYARSTNLKVETPLGSLVREESPQASLGQFVLPLAATPREYPFDWYSFRDAFNVTIFYLNGSHSEEILVRPSGKTEPPLNVKVYADPSLSPLVVDASQAIPTPEELEGRRLTVRLMRSSTTQWYVAVIAVIPLLLAALLAVVFLRPGAARRPNIGPEAIAAVTAALLAVLPIRLVLVPSSVTELTLVDYWLGFEVAVLAAVACLAVRRTL
jgi:hypothetical protein